jgi:hypothetical protein
MGWTWHDASGPQVFPNFHFFFFLPFIHASVGDFIWISTPTNRSSGVNKGTKN